MMPSMKCYECLKIKQCGIYLERDENDRPVPVYYCKPCLRRIRADKGETA